MKKIRKAPLLVASAVCALAVAPNVSPGQLGHEQRWMLWGTSICFDTCSVWGPLHNCCDDAKPPIR